MSGWIGVDLDGTLAVHAPEAGINTIGEPIPAMVARVKAWRAEGHPVRIMTARVGVCSRDQALEAFRDVRMTDLIAAVGDTLVRDLPVEEVFIRWQTHLIDMWCETHLGERLPVTCRKDFAMWQLWDDRAVQVLHNTGVQVADLAPGRPFHTAARQRVHDTLAALPAAEFARLGVFLLSVTHGHRGAYVAVHEAVQTFMQTEEAAGRFGEQSAGLPT